MDMNVSAIYMITNKLNGKRYIGKALNVRLRFISHCVKPKRLWRSTKRSKLNYDINKYGKDQFEVSVLHEFKNDQEYYLEGFYYEKYYMATLEPEYNIMFGCDGGGKTQGLDLDDDDYTLKARTNWNQQVAKFKSLYPTLESYLQDHVPTASVAKIAVRDTLSDNIKELCAKKKITIMKLEDETGLKRGTVYRWDKSIPSVKSLQLVSQYLKVSMDRLLRGVDYGNKA